MPALLVSRVVFFPVLGIGDTQILSANPEAASLFGFDDPRLMAGRYMSDLQPADWREYGRQRYAQRMEGQTLSKDYVVVVRHPDGTLAGQRREFGGFLAGPSPRQDMYLTYVRGTREVDHCPVRVLGEAERAQHLHWNGERTVADVRAALHDGVSGIDIPETFRDIINECAVLSSTVFRDDDIFSPLDLAFHPRISWSLRGQKTTQAGSLVRVHFTCPRCGWHWYGRGRGAVLQCTAPGCRKEFAW